MIADRRFEKPRLNARFAAAIALGAIITITIFGALLYTGAQSVEIERPFFHCDKLLDRAAVASPAEKVRLLQEYHEAYCD